MTRFTRRGDDRAQPRRCAYSFSTCSAEMQAVSLRTTARTSLSISSTAAPAAQHIAHSQ